MLAETEMDMIRGDETTCLDSPDGRKIFASSCVFQNENQRWELAVSGHIFDFFSGRNTETFIVNKNKTAQWKFPVNV